MNMENKNINNIQQRWLSGEDVNWGELYIDKNVPNRINLPHQLFVYSI